MAVATGLGFDVTQLETALKNLDRELKSVIANSEIVRNNFKQIFDPKNTNYAMLQSIEDAKKGLLDISKIKDPLKWDSKSVQHYIDKVNEMFHTLNALNNAAGFDFFGKVDFKQLGKALTNLRKIKSEVLDYEKRAEQSAKSNNQTYAGAIAFSTNAKSMEEERQAIENLKAAREKLSQTDADYATKLNNLNEAIQRHEKSIKEASKTDSQKAEESRKKAEALQKEAEAQRKANEELQRSTTSGALSYSRQAKSLSEIGNAIKYLEKARSNENLQTQQGRENYRTLTEEINRQKKTYEGLTGSVKNSHKGLINITDQLARKLAMVFSVSQIQGYINKLAQVRGEFELQQRSLQAILQNKNEANEVWNKTVDLAVKSPFRVKELTSYTKQLAAYRIESNKLYETNKMLADVSAGLGVDMSRLILAYGQVRSAEYLRGTELRQFTEAGVPMLAELARYLNEVKGKSVGVAEVFDMISKRMITFSDVEEVFKRMTAAGGVFYNMQEIQSETLKGQISNLKDSIDLMLNDIGKRTEGTMKNAVGAVKTLIDNYEKLIPVMKTIIALTAIHGIQLLSVSKKMLTLGRLNGVAIASGAKGFSVMQMLEIGLKSLVRGLINGTKSIAKFVSLNPWALFGTVAIATITKVIQKQNQYKKALEAIDKEHARVTQSLQTIGFGFDKSINAKNYSQAKEQLSQLIALAEREYNLKFNIEVGKLDESQVKETFEDIERQLTLVGVKAADFGKAIEQGFKVGDTFTKDLQDLKSSSSEAFQSMQSFALSLAYNLQNAKDNGQELTQQQEDALAVIREGKKDNERQLDYFERLRLAISDIVGDYDRLTTEVVVSNGANKKAVESLDDVTSRLKSLGINIDAIRPLFSLFGDFDKDVNNAKEEFDDFIKRLNTKGFSAMSPEDLLITLTTAVDTQASERDWNDFVKDYIKKWLEEVYPIKFKPEVDESASDILEQWQESYNKQFKGKTGFEEILKSATSHEEVIKRLNDLYKDQKDLVEQIQKAGTQGAYQGMTLSEEQKKLAEINEQLSWFGVDPSDKGKDAVKDKLKSQIELIKEMNKEYEKLNKTFDETTSKEKVVESYSKTFEEAFKGTGIDLTMRVVDEAKLKEAGKNAGETFTEEMRQTMSYLAEKGIYTRDLDDAAREAALNFIKNFEGVRNKAYEDIGSKRWAIGIGNNYDPETGKEITQNTYWSDEDIIRKNKIAMQTHMDALNKILDAHKDILVTSEQYTALLDLTWQTGGAAALTYAEDRDKFADWLEQIDKMPIVKVLEDGTRKMTDVFDIDVDKILADYDKAETAIEKVAIAMEYVGIRNAVDKDTTDFMIKRGQERAKLFRGDLEVAKLIEKSSINVANLDFTNLEGVAAMLKQLEPLAKKEGKEAYIALQKAISQVLVEIGVKESKEDAKRINDEVQALFDRYELSLDIKKLKVPKNLAEELFDFEYLDLKGLREAVVARKEEFIGTEQEEEYKKFLEKIDDMEDKAAKERMKTYSKYLVEGMNERVKLKVEEMRKLKEIEESEEFSPAQKQRIKEQVSKEAKAEQQKQEWKDFQGSEMYTLMFEDLEFLGTKALETLQEKLEKLKGSLSDLPASEVKEIIGQISKIEDITIERNPFAYMKELRKELKGMKSEEELQIDLFNANKLQEDAQNYIDAYNTIQGALDTGAINVFAEADTQDLALWQEMENIAIDLGVSMEDIVALKKKDVATGKQQATQATQGLNTYKKARKTLQEQYEAWGEIGGKMDEAFDVAKDLMTTLGVSTDSVAMSLVESAQGMGQLITSAVQFGLQMEIVGYQSNMALGVIGWILIAIQAIAKILSAIFSAKDKSLQKMVDDNLAKVEKLQEGYEKLEEAIDNAWSTASIQQFNSELKKTTQEMIAAQKAAIAAQEKRKGANKEGSDVYEELQEMYAELDELESQLAESLEESFSKVTAGILDSVHDAAREFTDAWYEAYAEAGDGLKGLEENFEEMFLNLAKNQAAMQITGAFAEQWKKELEKYIGDDDTELTTEEAKKWAESVRRTFPQLSEALENYFDALGGVVGTDAQGLSALSKSIQGVSEDTAQVIESLLNSMRFYVADSNQELKNQTRYMRDMYNLLNGMTMAHSQGGRGIKVVM